jgi:hypothetical protein
MGGSWHEHVFLSAQSALRHTNPQSGIEGEIRFEGWYWRQTVILEEAPWTDLVLALPLRKSPGDLRKPASVMSQREDWSLRAGLAEQRFGRSATGSKDGPQSLPDRNPSSSRGSIGGRAQAQGMQVPVPQPTGPRLPALKSRLFSPWT